jgi:hypothetical protein
MTWQILRHIACSKDEHESEAQVSKLVPTRWIMTTGLVAIGLLARSTEAHAGRAPGCSAASGPQNPIYPNGNVWTPDLRGAGTGGITGTNPRLGNGSLELALSGNLTDWSFFERIAPSGGWGLLSAIDCLSFDWYRTTIASPTDAPWLAQTPVLRLVVQDGDQISELVWEKYYTDGSATINDTWHDEDLLYQNLWRVVPGQGYTIAGCQQADPFFPNPLATFSVSGWSSSGCFSSNAFVSAIRVGIGSNWPHQYQGFVDNVRLGFNGSLAVNDNFELLRTSPVPEPATLALVATGLVGTIGMSWLKRKKKQPVS